MSKLKLQCLLVLSLDNLIMFNLGALDCLRLSYPYTLLSIGEINLIKSNQISSNNYYEILGKCFSPINKLILLRHIKSVG